MSKRSKECGKPVSELTAAELESELKRCRYFLQGVVRGEAAKGLRKRLYEIQKRLAKEAK